MMREATDRASSMPPASSGADLTGAGPSDPRSAPVGQLALQPYAPAARLSRHAPSGQLSRLFAS